MKIDVNTSEDELRNFIPKKNQPSQSLLRDGFIIFGLTLMALFCGTTYAFNFISSQVQYSLNMSNTMISVLGGLSLIGLQFTVLVGILIDNFGELATSVLSLILVVIPYLIISILKEYNWWASIICYILVSIGSGGCFLSALTCAIKMSPTGSGAGVALVSAGMSLSLALIIKISQLYNSNNDCGDECWRGDIRVWVICISFCYLLGIIGLSLFKPSNYPHLAPKDNQLEINENKDEEVESLTVERPVSFIKSLHILKHGYFYPLFIAFFAGVGSSTLIVTKATNLWDILNKDPSWNNWPANILVSFSFLNAGFNTLMALLVDFLQRKNLMKSTTLLIISLFIFSLNFGVMGLIEIFEFSSHAVIVLFAGCMAFSGAGFGIYLVLFPIITGQTYGFLNFGKYFSYLQIGASVAGVISPIFANLFYESTGHYYYIFFIFSALLFISALLLIFVKNSKFTHY